jgi:hypothetical protein
VLLLYHHGLEPRGLQIPYCQVRALLYLGSHRRRSSSLVGDTVPVRRNTTRMSVEAAQYCVGSGKLCFHKPLWQKDQPQRQPHPVLVRSECWHCHCERQANELDTFFFGNVFVVGDYSSDMSSLMTTASSRRRESAMTTFHQLEIISLPCPRQAQMLQHPARKENKMGMSDNLCVDHGLFLRLSADMKGCLPSAFLFRWRRGS